MTCLGLASLGLALLTGRGSMKCYMKKENKWTGCEQNERKEYEDEQMIGYAGGVHRIASELLIRCEAKAHRNKTVASHFCN